MKLKDLLLVADCNYHVFFKTEIANISGLPYVEIKKEQLKDYLDMTVLRVNTVSVYIFQKSWKKK